MSAAPIDTPDVRPVYVLQTRNGHGTWSDSNRYSDVNAAFDFAEEIMVFAQAGTDVRVIRRWVVS